MDGEAEGTKVRGIYCKEFVEWHMILNGGGGDVIQIP